MQSWLFLPWLTQIISRTAHGTPGEQRCLVEALLRLAHDYPQSLFYPLSVAENDFDEHGEKILEPVHAIMEPVARTVLGDCISQEYVVSLAIPALLI